MKNNNSNSLFSMKSDILTIQQIQFTELMIALIKNKSYTTYKFRMFSKFGPESWALWAVGSAFFTPQWLIAVMLNYRFLRGTYYYHLNIKEIDHIVFITKMVHVMFHETASRKLLVFTLYVNPHVEFKGAFGVTPIAPLDCQCRSEFNHL